MNTHTSIDYQKLQQEARNILSANDRGGYTLPNGNVYPYQWNWDSLFVALGWLTFDEKRGWQELESLFKGQWENGLIPSIVFHHYTNEYFPGPDVWQAKSATGIDTTGITQIPIIVWGTVLMYYLAENKALAEERIQAMYPALFKYLHWFFTQRKDAVTGLCKIYHGWEAMDNSPMWDLALSRVSPTSTKFERKDKNNVVAEQRPQQWDYERYISIVERMRSVQYDSRRYDEIAEMIIIDATVNAVLIAGAQALLPIAKKYGTGTQVAQLAQWEQETSRFLDFLWDDEFGMYVDYDVIGKQYIRERISGGVIPVLAGISGKNTTQVKKAVQRWISQDMPSADSKSEKFEAMRYWRGPSWTIVNFLVYAGCVRVGWMDEAEEIKQRSLQQIVTGKFYENFSPITREGGGGTDFSWTAASYLFWLDKDAYDCVHAIEKINSH